MMECPLLGLCDCPIDVIGLKEAPRAGENTQLEVKNWMKIFVLYAFIKRSINGETGRKKNDLEVLNADKHHVIITNFGAKLDWAGFKNDNCSVDNHCLFDTFLGVSNWRKAKYCVQGESGLEVKETVVSDCAKYIFGKFLIKRGK